jgi:hypothetical protein
MADYSAFPLWAVAEEGSSRSDPMWAGGLSPDHLPLSAPLVADLHEWAETHDRLLGPTFEWPSERAKVAFVAEGRRLLVRVREELGSNYDVVYFDEITGRVSDE